MTSSSDLFSHRYVPEVVTKTESQSEAVQAPAFSDGPQNESTAPTLPHS
jgi:hypothetical protein